MSTANPAAYGEETPQRRRARLILAVMNSFMAGAVGALTISIPVGVIGALLMAVLPYAPVLWRVIPEWAQANIITAVVAAFLGSAVLGTIIWGFSVAFYLALTLVPVMLALILAVALSSPTASDAD